VFGSKLPVMDDRGRLHLAVEHDRHEAADVVTGDAREVGATLRRHRDAHAPAARIRLVETDARFRRGDRAARHFGFALHHVERTTRDAAQTLLGVAPEELRIGGQNRIEARCREQLLHGAGVLLADERGRTGIDEVAGERRAAKRRVEPGARATRGDVGIELLEQRLRFFLRAHELELEQRGLTNQLTRALAIRETRKLDRDAIEALALDERLRHSELIDARAQNRHRAIDCVLRLGGAQA